MKYLYLSIALVFTAIFGEAQSLIAYNPQGTFFDWWSGDFQVPEVGTGTIDSCHIDIEIDGQRTIYNKHVETLEDYSINFIEMKPKPGGSNLKIHCTYNHNPDIEIVYTVIDATDNYQFTSPQGEE